MKIDRVKIHEKFGGHCAYCGKAITVKDMQVDHYWPQFLAHFQAPLDNNRIENLMPACRKCNNFKGGIVKTKRHRHKFNAVQTVRDGYKFHSKKEAHYYDMLCLLQRQGDVLFFLRQVPFHLPGNVVYRIDFQVFTKDGEVKFVDVKGVRTPEYIRNKKMVEALYPVIIEER